MDLDKTKKPRSEDEERVWMQYSDTLLRTAERLRGMEKRKGLEMGFRVHRMALAMIKSDGWLKYWMFRNTIWETLKYTVYYLGERMDRMGREEKDIKLLWRLDLLQYYVHLYESQGRRTAAHWAKIELGIEQEKAVKKAEKRREEEKAEEEEHAGETQWKLELLDSDENEVKKRMEDRVKEDDDGDKEGKESAAEKIKQRLERLTLQDHNYYLNVMEDEKRRKKHRLDELKRD